MPAHDTAAVPPRSSASTEHAPEARSVACWRRSSGCITLVPALLAVTPGIASAATYPSTMSPSL